MNIRYPALFTACALIGLFAGGRYLKKLPVLVWFVLTWGIFLFFYAGSYNYGADVRYSVVSTAPLAVLEGAGKLPQRLREQARGFPIVAYSIRR